MDKELNNLNIWYYTANPESVGGELALPKFLYEFITKNAAALGYKLENYGDGMALANESVDGWWKTRFLLNNMT